MVTKAQRILELMASMPDERGLPQKIAAIVGTTDSYVRTVARQRKGKYASEAEIRYLDSPLGRATRRSHNRAYYERHKEQRREYQRVYYRRRRSASTNASLEEV